ncbi:CCW12 [Candida pseudojiufengensis]|uniref:CCW12 n=1 Tax=Candida pseudojiufengensis TaxID=497109 RepID=UPI002224242D|nr:CCW12 [Candida pseudojiufengensis]KAI5961384.1 CCW12 [Candida pseudojiufengensis]
MQYSTLFTVAATLVSSSLATTSFEWETIYESHTTEVTITSCSENKCETTVNKVSPSVATTTVEGIETVYTTYCPLTEEEEVSLTSSTPVEIPTSSSIAGVASTLSTIVTTIEGVETIYTTYCPLTAESSPIKADVSTPIATAPIASSPVASASAPIAEIPSSSSIAGVATTPSTPSTPIAPIESPESSSESDIYVDITITPTVSTTENVEATETSQLTLFTSSLAASNSSQAGVQTYEGSGSKLMVGSGFAAIAGLAAAALV